MKNIYEIKLVHRETRVCRKLCNAQLNPNPVWDDDRTLHHEGIRIFRDVDALWWVEAISEGRREDIPFCTWNAWVQETKEHQDRR